MGYIDRNSMRSFLQVISSSSSVVCVCGCAFDHALVCVCFSAVSGDVTGPLSWPCTCGLSHSLSLTQCSATGHELMQETEPHTRTHTHMPKVEPPAS